MSASLLPLALLLAAPAPDPGAASARPGSGSLGELPLRHGLAWADVDSDGLDDALVLHPGGRPQLFRNLGNGEFEDRSLLLGELAGVASAAAWGDFDADGHVDLFFVVEEGAVRLLQNPGFGPFVDRTSELGLDGVTGTLAADWIDYDGDELSDLVLAGLAGPRLFRNVGGAFVESELEGPAVPAIAVATSAPSLGDRATDLPGGPGPAGTDRSASDSTSGSAPLGGAPGGSSASVLRVPNATDPAGPLPAAFACMASITDQASGECLMASTAPVLGMLYPMTQFLNVSDAGRVGVWTTSPVSNLHVQGDLPVGLAESHLYEEVISVDDRDAVVGLYSTPVGAWGSALVLGEVTGGSLVDKWAIARNTPSGGSRLRITYGPSSGWYNNPALMTIEPGGDVGIGPNFWQAEARLHVYDDATTGPAFKVETESFGTAMIVNTGPDDKAAWFGGSVSVGANSTGFDLPSVKLSTEPTPSGQNGRIDVYPGGSATTAATVGIDTTGGGYVSVQNPEGQQRVLLDTSAGAGYMRMYNNEGTHTVTLDSSDSTQAGFLQLYDAFGNLRIWLDASSAGKGRITCDVLEITGGADLVEGFDTREETVEPGTVLVIDEHEPGRLRVADAPYDAKVAGIASGAGGVDPGIRLGQGALTGETPLALNGRVYVKASAENGPIRPGDRLTTSSTAGHAMRVTDTLRAPGATIGKAMSALDEGTGLVLVLVNLQ